MKIYPLESLPVLTLALIRRGLGIAILTLACSFGCSNGPALPKPVKVTGQIQLKGKPVADATISYFAVAPVPGLPTSDRFRQGTIGADGRYTIDNVYPGEYVVSIYKMGGEAEVENAATPGDPAFAKYSTESPLRAAVSEEAAQFDFNL